MSVADQMRAMNLRMYIANCGAQELTPVGLDPRVRVARDRAVAELAVLNEAMFNELLSNA